MIEWVSVPIQFNDLANGNKCSLDTTSLDLVALSKFAFLDPSSRNIQDQQLFCWSQVLKVRIDVGGKKVDPVPPVILPYCES